MWMNMFSDGFPKKKLFVWQFYTKKKYLKTGWCKNLEDNKCKIGWHNIVLEHLCSSDGLPICQYFSISQQGHTSSS